ncbi:hypothetical protein [Pedobacter xixiisoli]|uniref:Uncharacterized protein n=1 Tax=Pedobacter xixiisoli TaxID=1476464 RepID=A0A286AED0_9SPHI|nr:hypothetical protein [Pedobacter xixiisoli]SOD20249.1 hypothetical protein SAMN06297358_3963 [Pedobacter xixiisoli]
MEESFHFKLRGLVYEIVPEEDNTFTIFKMEEEYLLITKLNGKKWVRIDYKTDEPVIEENDEVEDFGAIIEKYMTS